MVIRAAHARYHPDAPRLPPDEIAQTGRWTDSEGVPNIRALDRNVARLRATYRDFLPRGVPYVNLRALLGRMVNGQVAP